jgi:hypothetical protein
LNRDDPTCNERWTWCLCSLTCFCSICHSRPTPFSPHDFPSSTPHAPSPRRLLPLSI